MPPSTDWKEVIPEGEAERFERWAERLHDLQHRRARGKRADRGLHAKPQAGVEAEFTVLPDLPKEARVGLFAKPASHRAYARFSNGVGKRQADSKPDVRGLAFKVLGVPGQKIIPGLETAQTQDFLLIRTPSTPFRDADEFLWFLFAAGRPATLLPRAIAKFGPLRTLAIVARVAKQATAPTFSSAEADYFSAVPIQFGKLAAKYALAPHAPVGKPVHLAKSPDALRDDLVARLAAGPVVYDFRVQFFVDEKRTPIEDASREWREEVAPFVTLGRLTLPSQALESPRGRQVEEFVERLSFDPWHTTADFRPRGSLMRARNPAYRLSTAERGAAGEPDGTESFG